MFESITPGLTGEQVLIVTEDHTASAIGSGGIEVYATPAMIALMEAACVAAVEAMLPPGYASVGIEVNIRHVSATPVGEEVRAQAEVVDVEGKHILFNVRAWDEHDLIGEGTHIRYIIEIERFLNRLRDKGA